MGETVDGEPPIPRSDRVELLRRVCRVLNRNSVDFFLTCGTLLGFERDADFIEWDSDIDLGVFDAAEVFRSEADFADEDLTLDAVAPPRRIRKSLRARIVAAGDDMDPRLSLDIYEFERIEEGYAFFFAYRHWAYEGAARLMKRMLHAVDPDRYDVRYGFRRALTRSAHDGNSRERLLSLHERARRAATRQGIHVFRPFRSVERTWLGIDVRVPSNTVEHLRLFYGDDWRIPQPGYSGSLKRQINVRRKRL